MRTKKARVFVPDKFFDTYVMFASKERAYLCRRRYWVHHIMTRPNSLLDLIFLAKQWDPYWEPFGR